MPNVQVTTDKEDTINNGSESTVYSIHKYRDGEFMGMIGIFSTPKKAEAAKAKAAAKDQKGSKLKIYPWSLEANPEKIVFAVKADFSLWEEDEDYIVGIFAKEENAVKCKCKAEKKYKKTEYFQSFVQSWRLDKLEKVKVM